jgi:hypothetical protein
MVPYSSFPPFQRNFLAWSSVILLCLIFMALGLYVSQWFVLPVFLILFGSLPLLNSIVCPRCGTSLNAPGYLLGIPVPSGWRRKKCTKCGLDLTKPYQIN